MAMVSTSDFREHIKVLLPGRRAYGLIRKNGNIAVTLVHNEAVED